MELYGAVFLLGFLTAMAILLYKFYNCMTQGIQYEFPGIVLTFIGYFLAWLVCFVVWMQEPTELLYAHLMFLLNWFILVNLLLSVVEGLLMAKSRMTDGTIKAFSSRDRDLKAYYPGKGN